MLTQQQINALEERLEREIDASSLREVLEALATVCHLKADHLRSNWQDSMAARAWETIGRKLTRNISADGL